MESRAGKAPSGPLMRFTGARNDKPPAGMHGGLTRQGDCLYADFALRRRVSLAALNDLSIYLYASAILVGETTRRIGLNLDRGGGPLDAQRIAGKREPHTGYREMLLAPGEAPKGSNSIRASYLGVIPSVNRPGSTTEGSIGD
jgi:hypothetical protein